MKLLIIEDEARIAKRIERMSRAFFGTQLQSLAIIDSLQEGITYIEQHAIDVLLLDLNLNGENGFTILESVVSRGFHTIIISANTDRAITAFTYGVLDFVPKPFDQNRLAQAFLRISQPSNALQKNTKYLAIRKNGNIALIDVDDILYIKGAGIYSELYLKNGKQELHDKTLEKLAQLLPGNFERIHKSYIVPISQIQQLLVQPGSKYDAVLKTGEIIPIGRTRYHFLKERLL
ncbi:LytTR family two component transcriptional regulator [Chitinophaga skermanii]|uniref:LytTR family two component transcriptional regulator n=1 Tax=Chitinophaga skermanii TaxID=331697 RepID=A0A327QKQ2_9BACT|nr:LytTR family DNA-binding domain-containing protein [Chitinophaga skermanii]RAJ02337.1 LytTR family two component transcriptional regulator [Chitinophaga skermanii]